MQTIEIITMIWAMITSFWCLIAKVSGAGTLGMLLIKFISFITFIWFGYKLILLIP
jgi:Na+(H+)/acetate symporter ActP